MKNKKQMINGLGILNIYLKALWSAFLLILVPLGLAVLITWTALFDKDWDIVIFASILWPALCVWLVFGGAWPWDIWKDIFIGRTTVEGQVTGFGSETTTSQDGTWKEYYIYVKHNSRRSTFRLSKGIHNWLTKGDTVAVHYWPHSGTVASVEKLNL
ncbi:hypothetical protein ES707_17623 [subsurface metagenome]